MDPLVLAVSGASGQPLAQRALQLLLEAGERVEVVTSRGAITVWQAELGIRVPNEPRAQEAFWRERTGCQSGDDCERQFPHQGHGDPAGQHGQCRPHRRRRGHRPAGAGR